MASASINPGCADNPMSKETKGMASDLPEDQAPATPAPADEARLRIMVVDDNRDAAEILGMLLEALGHEVTLAYGARQALELAADATQDVFLLDIGLPGMDGTALARALRAGPRHRDALLVAVTGHGQDRDRDDTRAAGFDHHLLKPVHIDEINAVLPRPSRG